MRRALATLVVLAASLVATPASAALSCAGRTATIVGTDRREVLTGTPGDDVIVAGRGADTLIGLGGNDRLCGGRGRDFLFGGLGGDVLVGGRGADVLLGGAGNDFLDGGRDGDEVSFVFSTAGVRVDLDAGRARGDGLDLIRRVERVVGSAGADRLLGGARADHLVGDAGKDIILGRGGGDTLEGGRDDDDLGGGDGVDVAVFDAARGGVSANLSTGAATGEGTDALGGIEGMAGTRFGDILTGDGGSNTLLGNSGYDHLFGGAGDDALHGDRDGAEADAGDGIDSCTDTDPSPTCEAAGSTSQAPSAEISVPWPGAVLPLNELVRIRGRQLGNLDGVRLALRFLTPDGCGWWVRGRITSGGCASARYVTPALDQEDDTFSFRFRHAVPPGRYLLRVEVSTPGSTRFVFADSLQFRLI